MTDEREGQGSRLFTTGDMARMSGTTLRTVRFYEESGILAPERRSTGGHRLFNNRALDRLNFVNDLRAAGVSLDEIRTMLDLKRTAGDEQEAVECVLAAVDRQIVCLEKKLQQLSQLREGLLDARKMLASGCRNCTQPEMFPDDCERCDVVREADRLSLPMRVLWALGNENEE